jgi:hypothetical protein
MIEVFKTNVKQKVQAKMLVQHIQQNFKCYVVNFDLDDCDKILRVKSSNGAVESTSLIGLLRELGFYAEVLPGGP